MSRRRPSDVEAVYRAEEWRERASHRAERQETARMCRRHAAALACARGRLTAVRRVSYRAAVADYVAANKSAVACGATVGGNLADCEYVVFVRGGAATVAGLYDGSLTWRDQFIVWPFA